MRISLRLITQSPQQLTYRWTYVITSAYLRRRRHFHNSSMIVSCCRTSIIFKLDVTRDYYTSRDHFVSKLRIYLRGWSRYTSVRTWGFTGLLGDKVREPLFEFKCFVISSSNNYEMSRMRNNTMMNSSYNVLGN